MFFPIEKNNEIDTKLIIQIIQGKDKNVILPRLNIENKSFVNFLLTDSTLLKENRLGIAEPQSGIKINENQIEVVFVPLLCFDKTGHRVGYGGGYYDRFLKKCSANTIKIGISFFDPIEKIIDINNNDIKMNYCLTPNKIYEFWGYIFLLNNNIIPTPVEIEVSAILKTGSKKVKLSPPR